MAEHEDGANEGGTEHPKKGGKGMLIIIIVVVAALGAAAAAYFLFFRGGNAAHQAEGKGAEKDLKPALFALDPFVLNLAEQGRFLKVSMQFEIADASQQQFITERTPQVRDAIITLVSSKSADAVSSPEGKFQLKDEILLRANQAVGKGVIFKNLYFTEFVMQ